MTDAAVFVVTGPPGAGKSTVSRLLVSRFARSVLFESDWFWTILVGGIPPWQPEADSQNHVVVRAFGSAAAVLAEGGLPVVLDGVIGPWMLEEVAGECRRLDVAVHYLVLRPDLDACIARAQLRAREPARIAANEHLVDQGPIRQLWSSFADLAEMERHALDTTDLDAADAAALAWERFESGELAI